MLLMLRGAVWVAKVFPAVAGRGRCLSFGISVAVVALMRVSVPCTNEALGGAEAAADGPAQAARPGGLDFQRKRMCGVRVEGHWLKPGV